MSFLVEATGFEHATSWSRTKRATKLRYASIACYIISNRAPFCKRFCFLFGLRFSQTVRAANDAYAVL